MSDPTDMTVFALMKSRMQMLGARQKTISENVANVSTPGYTPSDVDQDAFAKTLSRFAGSGGAAPSRVEMMATQAGHLSAPTAGTPGFAVRKMPDSETTLDGNSVVVEEQMMKIAETRMEFETMVGLYQKSLGLLRLASRSPTR
ncbi:MAG: flagellar basal body protein [Alphaproteobacteria bacterium]|nr:flagellar basal body protein [Alphaproteobacteria bacterium]